MLSKCFYTNYNKTLHKTQLSFIHFRNSKIVRLVKEKILVYLRYIYNKLRFETDALNGYNHRVFVYMSRYPTKVAELM